MEIYTIEKDIRVVCITAESFPDKVMAAHNKLHNLVSDNNRQFFGISRPGEGGSIIYKAAAEVTEEEAKKTGLETFTIEKGKYISTFIPRFCDDPQSIERAFSELLKYPDINHESGYCLEIYETEIDVRCMVPLK
jgi:predicted transcriptional regulator YdeE